MKKIIFCLLFSLIMINSYSQSAVVSNPNASSNWLTGNTYTINWSFPAGSRPYVYIQLFGAGLSYVMTTSTPNDGSYSWTIPDCGEYPNLTPDKNLTVQIHSTSQGTGTQWSATSQTFHISHPAPSPPSDFTISNISSTSISLQWNAYQSCGATGFDVYSCNNQFIKNVGNSNGTTIYNLIPNTSYSFKVKAVNNSGSSSYTSCVYGTTLVPLPSKPATPTGETILYQNADNTEYTTIGAENATSYLWEINPSNAGTFSGTGTSATIDWDNNFVGQASITVTGINNGGNGEPSDPLLVNVYSRSVIFNQFAFYGHGTIANPSNSQNLINKGIPFRFKTKVLNELTQNLSTLQATLTCETAGVTINDGSVSFGNLGSGLSAWSNDEFEILVDETVVSGTELNFTLTCSDQLVTGGPWISTFSFPIEPLENGLIVLIDSNNGDGDGNPEPGETPNLMPTLNNVSTQTMALVNGTLSCEQSFINITSDSWNYNLISNVQTPIEPGNINIQPEYAYVFNYPANSPFQEINFNLLITANLNNSSGPLMKWTNSFLFNEGVEGPPIILTLTPLDNAVDIAIESNFDILFDKVINAVSNKFIYFYTSDGTLERTIEATDNQVSITDETVSINLTNDLNGGTSYYIIIDQGAFVGNSNNQFAGINSPTYWNFTTLQSDPPDTPLNLTATATSFSQIQLSWDEVAEADSYKVLSCDGNTIYVQSTTENSIFIDDLEQSTTYDFKVVAINSVGESAPSTCASETTFCMHTWGDPVIYSNSTIAYGIVTIEGEVASENDMVGVFVGTECRGISEVVLNEGIAYVTLAVQGEIVESLTFKVWDMSECSELDVNLSIQSNPGGNLGYPPNYLQIAATAQDPELIVSPVSQSVGSVAGSTSIDITSNVSWNITTTADWITISPLNGNNNATVSIDYTENSLTTQRVASITISGSGVEDEIVSITQNGIQGAAHFSTIWTENPYQPMNILVSNATIDDINLNVGDEIGVFDDDGSGNEICVGYGVVSQTITASDPLTIVVSSDDPSTSEIDGFTSGNSIIYRAWSTSDQTEYSTFQATYNPNLDDIFTSLGTAFVDIAFVSSVTQNLELSNGWNIMSFSVEPENMDLLSIVDPIVTSAELIKIIDESGGFIQSIPGIGWMNTIGDMENTEGYYIKVNTNTSLEVSGMPVSMPFSIPLNLGWNIMGYPLTQSQDGIEALQTLIDGNLLIKVLDETGGFIQNIPGIGWMNTIVNFESGEGYYIKLSASSTLTFGGDTPSWQCGDPLEDARDGKTYNTVLIGDQCWMADNLNVGTRIDGVVEQTDNNTVEKYCYDDDEANCDTYGGLYQWDEIMQYGTTEGVQGICPPTGGWHLPSDAEWTILTDYLGGSSIAGKELKSTSGWSNNGNGTNSVGFIGLPGGYRWTYGSFEDLGFQGDWWSSTEHSVDRAWGMGLYYFLDDGSNIFTYKTSGWSIRCIKD